MRSALGQDGLTVGTTMANGLTITATGTTRAVEQTFHTSIAQVQPRGGHIAFANVSGFSLPASAARDVLSVAGLDNLHVAQSQGLLRGRRPRVRSTRALYPAAIGHVATGGPQPCPAATTYAGEQAGQTAYAVYTADQIAAHCGFRNLYAAARPRVTGLHRRGGQPRCRHRHRGHRVRARRPRQRLRQPGPHLRGDRAAGGLAINSATGLISGTPTTPGAVTVTVAATDGFTNTGSAQFQFSVAPPPGVLAPKAAPSGEPTRPGAGAWHRTSRSGHKTSRQAIRVSELG